VGILVDFATGIDGHYSIALMASLHVIASVTFDFVRALSTVEGMIARHVVGGLVGAIGVEFDSGVEQGARSAAEKHGHEYTGGDLDSLPLIRVCRIIQHPMCVKEKVKIVQADHWFRLRESAEAILINEHVDILHTAETSAWTLRSLGDRHLTLFISLLSP